MNTVAKNIYEYFFKSESSGGLLLLLFSAMAVVWANSDPIGYTGLWQTTFEIRIGAFELGKPILLWINDLLMAVFFLLVGLEIKREILVGELSSPKDAALPAIAAIGGMVAPAGIYAVLNAGESSIRGWGVPMATDIAFSLGVLAMLGSRIPLALKVFLTALAIVDDLGAITVIGVFYTEQLNLAALGIAGALLTGLFVLNLIGVRRLSVYLLPGIIVWYFCLKSGLHATIAGVFLAFCIPARTALDTQSFSDKLSGLLNRFISSGPHTRHIMTSADRQSALYGMRHSLDAVETPLEKLEHALVPLVTFFIMPIFALANAGVILDRIPNFTDPVFLGIVLGLFLGNPLGILSLSFGAVKLGIAQLPPGVTYRHILGAAFLAGIGFTMSLFIAGLAFTEIQNVTSAKLGVLVGSLLSGIAGVLILRTLPKPESSS